MEAVRRDVLKAVGVAMIAPVGAQGLVVPASEAETAPAVTPCRLARSATAAVDRAICTIRICAGNDASDAWLQSVVLPALVAGKGVLWAAHYRSSSRQGRAQDALIVGAANATAFLLPDAPARQFVGQLSAGAHAHLLGPAKVEVLQEVTRLSPVRSATGLGSPQARWIILGNSERPYGVEDAFWKTHQPIAARQRLSRRPVDTRLLGCISGQEGFVQLDAFAAEPDAAANVALKARRLWSVMV